MTDRSVKVRLSADVTDYSAAMRRAGADTQNVTKKTSDLSRQIKQTFVGATVFAGIAAVGAAIHKTFTLGLTFTEQMNTLGAVTHATDGQMQQATKTAKALGNAIDIPNTSAADAADAMVELAKGGLTMQQSMEAARGTLMLAAAAGVDGAQAAQTQAQALNEFALSADKAGHVADVLANTANAASGDITDIATALTYSGGVAHQFGISIDDAATMLGIFAKNGLIGSMAGTTLRSMLIHLAAPSKQAQAAMQDLGLTVYNAQGKFVGLKSLSQQLAEAQAKMSPAAFQAATAIVFGQRAVQGATFAAQAGAAGFDDFGAKVKIAGGAVDYANAKMKGLPGTLQKARNQLENVALSLEERIAPAVSSMVEGFTGFVHDVGPAVVSTFGAIFDVLNVGFTVLGKVADVFKSLPGPVKDFGVALAGLAIANKIGLIGKMSSAFETVAIKAMYAGDALKSTRGALSTIGDEAALAGVSRMRVGLTLAGDAAKSAASKVTAAFGGPWGLAIAGATTAVTLFAKAWEDAKKPIADVNALVDENTGKLQENAAQTVANSFKDYLALLPKAGIQQGELTKGILQGGQAYDDLIAKLKDYQAKVANASRGDIGASSYSSAAKQRRDDLREVTELLDRLADQRNALTDAEQKGAAVGKEVAGATKDQAHAASGAQEAFDSARKALNGYTDDSGAASSSTVTAQDAFDLARKALNGYSSEAAIAALNMTDLQKRTIAATTAMLNQALQTRQAISSALTGFVSPTGAWDEAVQKAQQAAQGVGSSGGGSGTSPVEAAAQAAADAAVKAARRRADSTKKSAKDEQEAAVAAAGKIRDAIVARAEADQKATEQAEQDARNRVQAAKNEADRLRQISEQRTKDADAAELKLEDAQARMTAANAAVAAARAGLAGAQSPTERASWERALNGALNEQADATHNLASAQADYTDKTRKANDAKVKSKDATDKQTGAEKTYQKAQDTSAKVTEDVSARKKQADDDYARAKEKADTRYNKSVDAVNATLQRLIDKQDSVRSSAQDMSSGATSAVQGMAKDAQPSLQDYLDTLQDQVDAQRKWKDNIVKLAGKLPTDVALQLAQLGPKSAPMIQALVGGTDAQLDQFAKLFPQSTDKGVQDMVNSIVRAIVPVGDNALGLSNAMIEKFLQEFSSAKTNEQAQKAIADLQAAMQAQANRNPIVFSTTVDLGQINQQMANAFGPGYNPASFWGAAPKFAAGGDVKDGWFWSGEQGPELGYKAGNSVHMYSASQSARMAPSGPTVQQTNNIYYPQGVPPAVATVRELRDAAAMVGV